MSEIEGTREIERAEVENEAKPRASRQLAAEYHLKLTGPRGMAFDRELDERTASAVMLAAMGAAGSLAARLHERDAQLQPANVRPSTPELAVSVREYWTEHDVKTIPEKIVATAAYLRTGGQPTFTKDDVLRCFEDAGEPTPKNPSRDLSKTVLLGYIAPSRTQNGSYYVTAMGLDRIGERGNSTEA